jgi:single-stranded-DNA-specific exonuclease
LQSDEKILIYGDYDVDGTTAVALTYSFFSQFTSHIEYYIPDRHKEGYGISTIGIDYANEHGFSLIIALDCGIRSNDKVIYANALGIDFIICDHHLPGDEIPNAIAVLDPKQSDCEYPFKELSGCGIGFKLAQAYCEAMNLPAAKYEQYLDLTMVSIAADIVPIVDENRTLAYHGLLKLNENPCSGLKALMEIAGKTTNYTITDVVFILAPRINAAGRMDHGKQAVKMLLCEDDMALEQSSLINLQNTERKTFDQNITLEALALIEENEVLINKKTTVVYQKDWNKGVIGIVASRLTEKYYRPTIVLTESNGNYTGSARSVAGYDLYEALLACSDLLEQFGGHKFAAGLTLKPENLIPFSEKFESIVAATIHPSLLIPEIKIDAEIKLTQIDSKFYRILVQMAPFGPQNISPTFVSHGLSLAGTTQIVGTNHLKLSVKQQNSAIFECIAFGLAEFEQLLHPNTLFSICYTIEENVWKEKRKLQLNIKGIKIIETS